MALKGTHEAQVIAALPNGRLQVVLKNYHHQSAEGLTVRILRQRAGRSSGSYNLPQQGDWGLVQFTSNDGRTGVWMGSLPDDYSNANPDELFEQDPEAELEHHPGDTYTIHHGDGSTETRYPDGSLLKLQTSKDGTLSNSGKRAEPTPRFASRKTGEAQSERQELQPHTEPPLDVTFLHASGSSIELTADGSFNMATPQGHMLRIHDGTERVRDTAYPHDITATPQEDSGRLESEIVLSTEVGHKVTLHDDPQNDNDRHISVETPKGHKLELRDSSEVKTTLTTPAGYMLELNDDTKKIIVTTPGGRSITLDDAGQNINVQDPSTLILKAPTWNTQGTVANLQHGIINLAGGGPGVARIGDMVQVTIASGSSAGVHMGVIVSGSGKVFSA